MSNYYQCPICKKYGWRDEHICPLVFSFKHEEWGDDFQEIRANSFEEAAEEFAKEYNENRDYSLIDGEEEVIITDGITEKIFIVSAQQAIDYIVTEKKQIRKEKNKNG